MEWLKSHEIKAAQKESRQAANRERYRHVKIRDMQIADADEEITKVATAAVYKLRDMLTYEATLNWLNVNCKINTCYVRDMTIGERVHLIRQYMKIGK